MYKRQVEGDSFDDKLNTLYDRFNFEQPEDFKGRSLSVSDVITGKEYYDLQADKLLWNQQQFDRPVEK